MTVDASRFAALLAARRAELGTLLHGGAAAAAPVELDPQVQGRLSRMDALQGQAMAQATMQRRRAEIGKIDAALRRIETGEYGYCMSCGDEIAVRRLELDPAITRCFDCANG